MKHEQKSPRAGDTAAGAKMNPTGAQTTASPSQSSKASPEVSVKGTCPASHISDTHPFHPNGTGVFATPSGQEGETELKAESEVESKSYSPSKDSANDDAD